MRTIHFRDLKGLESKATKYLVWTSLIPEEEAIPEMDKFFHEEGLIEDDNHLVAIYKIMGNVKGNTGRSDVLMEFSNPDSPINPLARVRLGAEIKWLLDFINNYEEDYFN